MIRMHECQGNKLPKYPFVFPMPVLTLEELAAYRVCLEVWHSYTRPHMDQCWRKSPVEDRYENDVKKMIESLKTPRRIQAMLENCMEEILEEFSRWIYHFDDEVFDYRSDFYGLPAIKVMHCTWLSTGQVDYRKSAENVLTAGTLNLRQKFILMSFYSMEEQIRANDPTLLAGHFDDAELRGDAMKFYWICCLKNELYKLPILGDNTLNENMAWFCRNNIFSLEYFWDRLKNGNRISTARAALLEADEILEWKIFDRLLRSIYLTEANFGVVAALASELIAVSLAYSRRSSPFDPLRLWLRFKNEITDRCFFNVLRCAFPNVVHSEEKIQLLMEIWRTANDHHRMYAGRKLKVLLEKFSQSFNDKHEIYNICPIAVEFLLQILSDQSEENRSTLAFRCAPFVFPFFRGVEPLQKFLDLCLPNTNQQSEFKRQASDSLTFRKTCLFFLEGRYNVEGLHSIVRWLCCDVGPNAVRAFNEKLLTEMLEMLAKYSPPVRQFMVDFDRWIELSNFIDGTFAEAAHLAFQMKLKFIEATFSELHNLYFRERIDIIMKITETVIPIEELPAFKSGYLYLFARHLDDKRFWNSELENNEKFFVDFIEWCCDHDERAMAEFKLKAPHDVIFRRIFEQLVDTIEQNSEPIFDIKMRLSRLNSYLNWYLGSDEEIERVKLDWINRPDSELKIISLVLERNNVSCLQILLEWFFDDDTEAIESFKKQKLINR